MIGLLEMCAGHLHCMDMPAIENWFKRRHGQYSARHPLTLGDELVCLGKVSCYLHLHVFLPKPNKIEI